MKKLVFSIAAIALIGTPAFAADMPVKAPPPAPAPVYTWTGWYVGGNVGYSWGDARTDIAGTGTTFSVPTFFGGFPSNVTFAGSNTAALQGVIGGGQVGYNFQFATRWLLGFEADFQGSGERGSNTSANSLSGSLCFNGSAGPPAFKPVCFTNPSAHFPVNATAATAYDAQIDWFGTVRGRLGYLVNDQFLLYGTGGLAYGQVKVSGVTNVNGSVEAAVSGEILPFAAPGTSGFSASRTNIGWTAGAGIEGRFAYWLPTGWTWKLEYLYLDLGSLDTLSPFPPANPSSNVLGATPFTGPMTTHTHFTDNIVRVGLNYKFTN